MLKIGHRGASGHAPENTLSSFKKALALQVDMVELDIHSCKSGEIITIHDATVDRTTNGSGKVRDYNLLELQQLDAGEGEIIPTLTQVLDLIDKLTKVNIEVKATDTILAVNDIVKHYVNKRDWHYEHFLVSSFLPSELELLRENNKLVAISQLLEDIPDNMDHLIASVNPTIISPAHQAITSESIQRLRQYQSKIFAWTVNDLSDIKRLRQLKIDGIISDYPDRI